MAKKNTLRSGSKENSNTTNKRKSKIAQTLKSWIYKVVFYFFIITIGSVVVFKFVPIIYTWTMIDQKIEALMDGKDAEIHYSWRSYDEISKEMPLAVVASEDQLFPTHFGFDLKMMRYAYNNNMRGKKVKGASTITQQVAKNVFLWQNRSYIRKILEAYFTFLIEVIWGKQRILEVYINVAEMGDNIFGAQAAAKDYFHKDAINLTRNEAARLAAVLPSPRKWSVLRSGPYVSRRVPQIMRQMRALGGTAYIKNLRTF